MFTLHWAMCLWPGLGLRSVPAFAGSPDVAAVPEHRVPGALPEGGASSRWSAVAFVTWTVLRCFVITKCNLRTA